MLCYFPLWDEHWRCEKATLPSSYIQHYHYVPCVISQQYHNLFLHTRLELCVVFLLLITVLCQLLVRSGLFVTSKASRFPEAVVIFSPLHDIISLIRTAWSLQWRSSVKLPCAYKYGKMEYCPFIFRHKTRRYEKGIICTKN